MTIDELDERIKHIEKYANNKKRELYKEYAFSNNPYKIGDIITDHYHTIEIESIKWVMNFSPNVPCCLYTGKQLKKDLTPYKSETISSIHQENIIE